MRATILAAVFVWVAIPAVAQVSAPQCHRTASARPAPSQQLLAARREAKQACQSDTAAFCSAVEPGCGRPMQCLRLHSDQLSSACKTALEQLHLASHQTAP